MVCQNVLFGWIALSYVWLVAALPTCDVVVLEIRELKPASMFSYCLGKTTLHELRASWTLGFCTSASMFPGGCFVHFSLLVFEGV